MLPVSGGLFESIVMEIDGVDYLTVEIHKNPDAIEADLVVEVSPDLHDWQSGDGVVTILEETSTLLRARIDSPISETPRQFVRLRVIFAPN